MIKYFKSLLDCLWKIEKDLHTIASGMKIDKENYSIEKSKEDTVELINFIKKLIN